MTHSITEDDVRRIFREEFATVIGAGLRRRPPSPAPHPGLGSALERFAAANVALGEVVGGGALFVRWCSWAAQEAPEVAGVSGTAFGTAVGRGGPLVRVRGRGGRFYMRAIPVLDGPQGSGKTTAVRAALEGRDAVTLAELAETLHIPAVQQHRAAGRLVAELVALGWRRGARRAGQGAAVWERGF